MKYEEVLDMLNKGFTVDEIRAMEHAEPQQDSDTTTEPETSTAPEDNEMISQFRESITELKDAFADLKKEMQAFNIMNSQLPPENIRTGDDIFASIINPFEGNKKG